MSVGKIILARHGQDEDNLKKILNGRRNSPLTPLGVAQAHELGQKLLVANLNIKHIFCSPLQRAHRTAEICSHYLGVPVSVLDCLIERDHGVLEGHPFSEIPLLAKSYEVKNGHTYVMEAEGSEDYPTLIARGGEAMREVKRQVCRLKIFGDVLVVSHGAIGRAMEAEHKGMSWREMFDCLTSFKNCEFRVLD